MLSVVRDRPTATVVGGGPAGLMAAQVLASSGIAVTVHEHMASMGRKLLLAGRSGLNITHSEPIDQLMARYGPAAERLRPAFAVFGSTELRAWCAELGEPTFVGSSGRVFPSSFRATPLLRAWLAHLRALGVTFVLRDRWTGWAADADGRPDPHRSIFSNSGHELIEVRGDVTVLALGGASWPRVGSDGGWVDIVRGAGITVSELKPANCGIRLPWRADFIDRFAGVPLKNISIVVNGVGVRGDAMITATGMEGGPVYAQSSAIRDAIDLHGQCVMTVDLQPDLSVDELAQRLQHRRQKDSFATALRRAVGLSPVAVALLRATSDERPPSDAAELAALLKAMPLHVESVMPMSRAISSAGGIAMVEVDDAFMLRRLPGTFVAGEMLDWDAPTGGYLLQASFSTAVAAANGAIAWIASGTGV